MKTRAGGTIRIVRSVGGISHHGHIFFPIRTSQLVNNMHVFITDAQSMPYLKVSQTTQEVLSLLKAFNDFILLLTINARTNALYQNITLITKLHNGINLVSPWSAFPILLTRRGFSIFGEGHWRSSTWCTPATILNCKHFVTRSRGSYGAFCNSIFSIPVKSIQDRIFSFKRLDCTFRGVFIASTGFVA